FLFIDEIVWKIVKFASLLKSYKFKFEICQKTSESRKG
ncbi:MAG: hypothetical protein ACI84S_000734, partial [Thalassomonas sp.]